MGRIRLLALLLAGAVFVNLCSQTVLRAAGMKEKTENRKHFMKVEDLFANPDKGGEEEND